MKIKSIIPFFAIIGILQATVFAQTSEIQINQAREAITKQDYPSALTAIETVLKTEPKNDAALAEKARVLFFQKKFAEALAEIGKALAINPKNFVALNLRGLIKTSNNDDAGAVADFTAAINANPAFSKAYANRATTNIRLRAKQDLIITDFLKARELDPTSAAIAKEIAVFCLNHTEFGCKPEIEDLMKLSPNGYAYYLRGLRELDRVLEKGSIYSNYQESSAKALADFEKAIALDKKIADYPNFYRQFGRIHYFAKTYAASIENLNKQIAADTATNKKSAWNYIQRSQTYMAMGDWAAALKDFDELERIDPKIPQIYLGRGDYFRDAKDYDKALIEYKKFNQLFDGSYANWKLAYVYGLKKDYANAEANLKIVWGLKSGTRSSWIKNADFRVPNCQKVSLEAEIELNKGNSERASSLFYQASNGNHDTDKNCMANAAYQNGLLTLDKAPWSAISAFERVLELGVSGYPDAQAKLEQAKNKDRKVPTYGGNSQNPFAGMSAEQRRAAGKALKSLDEKDKFLGEAQKEYGAMMEKVAIRKESFNRTSEKLQTDSRNRTYATQMKSDAEAIIQLYTDFLSKYENRLEKMGVARRDNTIDLLNEEMVDMRKEIEQNKKNLKIIADLLK